MHEHTTKQSETLHAARHDLPLSDYTNAEELVWRHGKNMRYCYPWGKWLLWNERYWELDTTGHIMRLAKETVKHLARRLETVDDEKSKAWLAHIKSSLNTGRLTAMVQQAQCEVAVKPEQLDQHPWLLNCANGTLDLRTGTLRPHARDDLLTIGLDVSYDPHAAYPTWDTFLHKIMQGNATMIAFLQRVVGYAASGSVQEQKLFVLWGTGANGKSTFLNTLLTLLGPYGMKATSDLLMMSKSDRHPTERTDLCGKRLVAAIETEQGRRLSEVFVKEATGGDRIRARRMREDNWEFSPTHTILLGTNHKPEIRGTDLAIWRRVTLIPFTVTIPTDEQDPTLMAQLETEFPGILAWVVRGCLAWQTDGLQVPAAVEDATADYKKEMDILQAFLDECCFVDKGKKSPFTKATELYTAYQQWCGRGGEEAVTQRRFGTSLGERGFTNDKKNFGKVWEGIGLHPEYRADAPRDEESRKKARTGAPLQHKGAPVQPVDTEEDIESVEEAGAPCEPILPISELNFPREAHTRKKGSQGAQGAPGRNGTDLSADLPSLVRHARPARGRPCPNPRCWGTVEHKYSAVRCNKCQKTEAEILEQFPHAGRG